MPVNENKNHWILVMAFPLAKLVVSCDPLKIDFKRKASEINVFNELLWKKKSEHAFSVIEIRYSKCQEEAKYNCGVFVLAMAMENTCDGFDNYSSCRV